MRNASEREHAGFVSPGGEPPTPELRRVILIQITPLI